ncbi:site-2 protease family protein [Fimbriiglobus ruber]|uniref:Membrane-associated zinc metalloprotease n=1 Tax=Fimbriiglobus ruber TaxID=1908690 RepID=A0A225DQB7_9BACT|nr:site-2 protease family protein [Fimbriiglobus ruber]OWK43283.1 Membrane-associated zinc metalloprotease [Fimbriiglobus ruber]
MDPNAPANRTPVTPQPGTSGAAPGAAEEPPAAPPDASLGGWFRQNGLQLVVIAVVVAVVCNFWHPLDVILAGFGMSLIIFIHELGHFAAAKACDVHVKTFSIGFGPALPFCQFKYGETTYKLAMIPLGGFVAMVGETDEHGDLVEPEPEAGGPGGDNGGDDEGVPDDPRSFKNKSVLQRMFIISAGVIMNIILAAGCFVATYLHGVQEKPAVAASIEPGSAAWRSGMHVGTEIKKINSQDNPWFDDIRPVVSSTTKGETVTLITEYRGGPLETVVVEPIRAEGVLFPQLGIAPPSKLALLALKRDENPPYTPGSAASKATAQDGGPGFLPGDTIVGMSADPVNLSEYDPAKISPIDPKRDGLPGGYFDYQKRLIRLAGKPVTFQVVRKTEGPPAAPVAVTVPPAYRQDIGLRMRIGAVVAVRSGSPAEKAQVQVRKMEKDKVLAAGDEIAAVEVPEADGSTTRFTADKDDKGNPQAHPPVKVRPLDPLKLPEDLDAWADRSPTHRRVRVYVLREGDHTQQRVPLDMEWDASYRYESTFIANPGTPVPINGLGLAYHVQSVVDTVEPFAAADRSKAADAARAAEKVPGGPAAVAAEFARLTKDLTPSPAAAAGLRPNDRIVQVRIKAQDTKGKEMTGKWGDAAAHHWAYVDLTIQKQPLLISVELKIDRDEQVVSLTPTVDESWPVEERGLFLAAETQTQKADGIADALDMGAHRTVRVIKMTYLSLYSIAFGRISVTMMSGPLTLARASYLIAGEDVWHLILFMALISVNLAVVNFLPIPVLDGGHMVFLLYEAVRGKPAPVSVQVVLTYLGFAIIGGLMLFVIGLDLWRLFFS